MNSPKILIIGYEVAPFYKRGGLGDVLGSLPIALTKQGIDIRVVMPYYHVIKRKFPQKEIGSFTIVFDKKEETVTVCQGSLPSSHVPIYFLANRQLISVINLKKKRIEEFVFFDLAVAGLINWFESENIFIPDLVHCNDWHTALIPLLLRRRMHSSIKTLLTIHNLGYQGKGSFSVLDQAGIEDVELKILSRRSPVTEMNSLGEGILHASAITTVSPEYANEISQVRKRTRIYHYFRLREREHEKKEKLEGILNGIDETIWNPESDKVIASRYKISTVTEGKMKNKKELLEKFNFPDRPTYSFIGRMAPQKGVKVIARAVEDLVGLGCNILFLGSGDRDIEDMVRAVVKRNPHAVACELEYSEDYAHKFYAGSDFLLIPSLYEPCGLIQMAAMKYGTIPVASRTGGLIDTIEDGKTGFFFTPGSAESLVKAVRHSLEVYGDDQKLGAMRKWCMEQDFSWDKSAKEYKSLYEKILALHSSG